MLITARRRTARRHPSRPPADRQRRVRAALGGSADLVPSRRCVRHRSARHRHPGRAGVRAVGGDEGDDRLRPGGRRAGRLPHPRRAAQRAGLRAGVPAGQRDDQDSADRSPRWQRHTSSEGGPDWSAGSEARAVSLSGRIIHEPPGVSRLGDGSTRYIAATIARPPTIILTVHRLPAQRHRERGRPHRFHGHDHRSPGRLDPSLSPGLQHHRDSARDHRQIAARSASPARSPAAAITAREDPTARPTARRRTVITTAAPRSG